MTTLKTELNDIIAHVREHDYTKEIFRDYKRIKSRGEIFTPTSLVQEILDNFPQDLFTDPTKTFIDPTCGDGQFLGEVLIRKVQNGIDFKTALESIYGIDIMFDNVLLCRKRLLCGQLQYKKIVERNIVCYDALDFDYRFNLIKNGILVEN